MSEYNFTEFTGAGGRFKSYISLGEKSGFGLSSGFVNRYNDELKDVVGVKLYFDASKNAVGFNFVKKVEEGMIHVKLKDKSGYISAQSFIAKFGINQKISAGQYDPIVNEDPIHGKLFVIELKK